METYTGIFGPVILGLPSPVINPLIHTTDSPFTYLVTPELKVSSDLMVYARVASGYRAGGPNTTAAIFDLPPRFAPDTTTNYEIGVKGSTPNHKLSFDASLYYIDWKNIQLSLVDSSNGQTYFTNGSHAKSEGLEISAEARPLSGLTINGWIALDDAVLTQRLPATASVYGASGDRLPYTAPFSANLSLEQRIPITSELTGFLGADASYVGQRDGPFNSFGVPRQNLPSYVKTDLQARFEYNEWTINLFANNVMNTRGVISGGRGTLLPYAFTYIEPRTVGLSVAKKF
jgi:outer membrane receptor protein involved in Fe transport